MVVTLKFLAIEQLNEVQLVSLEVLIHARIGDVWDDVVGRRGSASTVSASRIGATVLGAEGGSLVDGWEKGAPIALIGFSPRVQSDVAGEVVGFGT